MSTRRHDIGDSRLIAAAVMAVATIVAAFIAGTMQRPSASHAAARSIHRSVTAFPAPSPTVTVTVKASPSPGIRRRSPKPGSTSERASTSSVPILMPVNQPGWSLAWHGTVHIGLAGIVLSASGPHGGDGNDFDLQYVPPSSNGGGWVVGQYIGTWAVWQSENRPGPSSINGLLNSGDYGSPSSRAYVGDRLCLGSDGRISTSIIVYMQIISVDTSGVAADIWLWDGSS
jgi:hypothetical protein